MEPEPHKVPIRFYEIDLLRFLAALSVVIYHYTYPGHAQGNYSPIAFPEIGKVTKYGYLGVELFFIVSGYVVLLSAQGKTVRQFFLSRITRLYPAFWVACTLTFVIKLLCGPGPSDVAMSPYLHASLGQYAYNMTMLQEFFHVFNVDGAYWSLTIEITFYFIISLLIGYGLIKHIDWFIIVWLAFTALPARFHAGSAFDSLLFPQYAPYFSAGMLFYLLQAPQGRTVRRYVLLFFAYTLAMRACRGQVVEMSAFFQDDFSWKVACLITTSFFLVISLITFRKIDLSKIAWLAWLGALTYPLYLIHSDIVFIAFHRLNYLGNKYALVAATIAAMLTAAYFIHVLVEKRFSKVLGTSANLLLDKLGQKPEA